MQTPKVLCDLHDVLRANQEAAVRNKVSLNIQHEDLGWSQRKSKGNIKKNC